MSWLRAMFAFAFVIAFAASGVACRPARDARLVGVDDPTEDRQDRDDRDDPDDDPNDAARIARLRVHPSGAMVPFTERGDFSEAALSRGVRATSEQCAKVAMAVWVATKADHGECLRYWAAGFDNHPTRAIVFFPGDAWRGFGKTDASYLSMTPEKVQAAADLWSRRLRMPYIFFGRPGTYGSSGDHMQRKRLIESQLVSAALDQIVARYQLHELVVAGQSGGGHITASLLTLRSDIVCAVPTSSPSSPRVRMEMYGWSRDTTGFADSYEPTDHLDRAHMNPNLRVFVLESPTDTKVPWQMQTILADKLTKIGVPAFVLKGEGTGPRHHGLSNSSRVIAGDCARDFSNESIRDHAAKGLKG